MNPTAREILDSTVFKKAQKEVVEGIKEQWSTEPSQPAREALWHQLQATAALTHRLKVLADRDTVALHGTD